MLEPRPLARTQPPAYPTLREVLRDPAHLQGLPNPSWQRLATAASVGLVLALPTGCDWFRTLAGYPSPTPTRVARPPIAVTTAGDVAPAPPTPREILRWQAMDVFPQAKQPFAAVEREIGGYQLVLESRDHRVGLLLPLEGVPATQPSESLSLDANGFGKWRETPDAGVMYVGLAPVEEGPEAVRVWGMRFYLWVLSREDAATQTAPAGTTADHGTVPGPAADARLVSPLAPGE